MKKILTRQANEEISTACIMLRSSMVVFSAREALKNPDNNVGYIAKVASRGSIIEGLIDTRNWKILFENKDWLNLLATAENVNIFLGGKFLPFFATIRKYFPNETKAHLIPRKIYDR